MHACSMNSGGVVAVAIITSGMIWYIAVCMHSKTNITHADRFIFLCFLQICCQFDFHRLPGSKVSCPWKIRPQLITNNNIQERQV